MNGRYTYKSEKKKQKKEKSIKKIWCLCFFFFLGENSKYLKNIQYDCSRSNNNNNYDTRVYFQT
jgi:hypothetical protein